jgi:hypothetical protein
MAQRTVWCVRWSERVGWTPWRMSLAIAATLGAAFVALEHALGRIALLESEAHVAADFQVGLGLIALVAYWPGAFAAAVRGAERTWRELAPALALRSQADAPPPPGRVETRALRRVGLVGAAVAVGIPLATNLELATWVLWELPPEAIAHRLLLLPSGWLAARFFAVVWGESRRLAALGAPGRLRVDLLDLRPLAPLARAGMRQALLGAGALSVLLVAFRDPSVAPGFAYVVATASAANFVFCLFALWLAVRGGHQAIQREKAHATETADLALRALRQPRAAHAAGALADALAWKRFVAQAPDWPIDFPTLQRFVIPLALPLASLLAGVWLQVLLERLLRG